jgi:hypothetical protein
MPEKICTLCQLPKDLENDFNKKASSKDGRQNVCQECNRQRSQNYYHSNLEKHRKDTIERGKINRRKLLQYCFDYLKTHGCVDCPETDPACLEFDHVRGKKIRAISGMVKRNTSLENVILEIAKCDVRCANCHRKKTAKDQHWYKNINTGTIAQPGRAAGF